MRYYLSWAIALLWHQSPAPKVSCLVCDQLEFPASSISS